MGREQAWNGKVLRDSLSRRKATGIPEATWWPGQEMVSQESDVERETILLLGQGPKS